MMNFGELDSIFLLKDGQSRCISAENPNGLKGAAGQESSILGKSRKGRPCITLPSGETTLLAEIDGPGIITHLWMTVTNCTDAGPYVLRDLVIRMYWDDEKEPSVESPLGDFFCCGFGMSCYVVSIPICVNPERGFNCYFPMPFQKKAKITIENQHPNKIEGFFYEFDYLLNPNFLGNFAYFHAQWRRTPITTLQKDYTILDNVFGRGHYIGTYIALTVLERCWWGEGEIKFYLDGDQEYPTICGTGMEDYFGGAWSFGTQLDGNEHLFCTPFMGYPFYSKHICFQNKYFNQDAPTMRGFYRWHIPDRINFNETIRITLQQIGLNQDGLFERQDDLSSVAYWYQQEPHHAFSSFPHPKDRWPR